MQLEQDYASGEIKRCTTFFQKNSGLKKIKHQISKLEIEAPDIQDQIRNLKERLTSLEPKSLNKFPARLNFNERIGVQNELNQIKK